VYRGVIRQMLSRQVSPIRLSHSYPLKVAGVTSTPNMAIGKHGTQFMAANFSHLSTIFSDLHGSPFLNWEAIQAGQFVDYSISYHCTYC